MRKRCHGTIKGQLAVLQDRLSVEELNTSGAGTSTGKGGATKFAELSYPSEAWIEVANLARAPYTVQIAQRRHRRLLHFIYRGHPLMRSMFSIILMSCRSRSDKGTSFSLSYRQPALPKTLIARGVWKQ